MISYCSIFFALILFFSFYNSFRLLRVTQIESFSNNHPGSKLVGKTPYYKKVYQPGEDAPFIGTNQYKNTNKYYYTPYVTNIPKQYQSIYQAKNFWPFYTQNGVHPDNRLAWVKNAPYFGKYHLPVVTECPDRIRNFEWLLTSQPGPKKEIPKGISTGWEVKN